jgi:hypothetical protein
MATFSGTIDQWVSATKERTEAVWKESAQRVYGRSIDYLSGELVGVITGFLRASARASTDAMPSIDPGAAPKEGQAYAPSGGVVLTIAGAALGQTLYIGWTANYAAYVHEGTSKMAPRPFVALSAEQWPAIVNQVSEEAKSRASQ